MNKKALSMLLFTCFFCFFSACLSHSQDGDSSSSPFSLNANIMEIDLNNKQLIVGEKYVNLLSNGKGLQKRWTTLFLDEDNSSISPKHLNVQDRVLVEGEIDSAGTITAEKVTLLESAVATPKTTKENTEEDTLQMENGVWKN